MKYLIKPHKINASQLRRGRAIELSKTERNICDVDDFKGSLAGLYRRGFVNTKMAMLDGKRNTQVYYPGRHRFLLI